MFEKGNYVFKFLDCVCVCICFYVLRKQKQIVNFLFYYFFLLNLSSKWNQPQTEHKDIGIIFCKKKNHCHSSLIAKCENKELRIKTRMNNLTWAHMGNAAKGRIRWIFHNHIICLRGSNHQCYHVRFDLTCTMWRKTNRISGKHIFGIIHTL